MTDRAQRRFSWVYENWRIDESRFLIGGYRTAYSDGYIDTHHVTNDFFITVNGFEAHLVEGGVQFMPTEWRHHDEDWNLEDRWIDMLPVIKWFFSLPEEDSDLPQ